MDTLDFLKMREEVKELAKKTPLFSTQPEKFEQLSVALGALTQSAQSEKIVLYLKQLFSEANEDFGKVIEVLKTATAD